MIQTVYSSKFIIAELKESPFFVFIHSLIKTCLAEGYSPSRIRHGLGGIVRFVRWSSSRQIAVKNIRKKHVDEFLEALTARVPTARVSGLSYFSRRFFKIIEDATGNNLLAYHVSNIGPEVRSYTDRYCKYLRDVRGLSELSIPRMASLVDIFLSWRFGRRKVDLKILVAKDFVEFIHWRSKSRKPKTLQTDAAALKSYCRYMFGHGMTKSDLSIVIPKVAGWRNQHHIETLSEEEITSLLESIDQSTSRGIREFTIVLLIIQYGLRAIEVARLQLSDILWEQKKILIRGKGPKNAELPLTENAAFALRRYIDSARPLTNINLVFLTTKPPFHGIDAQAGVSGVVGRAMKKAGIKKPALGTRILRATTASRILNNGGTLQQVKELLRHSHMDTTARYIRVDFKRLALVALPWPEKSTRRK